jgi:transketolase
VALPAVRVVVVGVCGAGKSELARRLRARGVAARSVAQEHSHVADLWRHEGEPDVLIYLGASARAVRRRGRLGLTGAALAEQRRRLTPARRHAHLRLATDRLSPQEVEAAAVRVIAGILARGRGAMQVTTTPSTAPRPAGTRDASGAPDVDRLVAIARGLRRDILTMTTRAGSGHPSSSMSAIDVITALYCGGILRHDPQRPHDPDRDRFIMSKGHASPALYAILAERGYFAHDLLDTLRQTGSPLEGHPNMRRLPGVEASTGSLGQGLSIGMGHALGARLDGRRYRVYVMTGDGEMEEGQIWEAIMSAPFNRVDNLTLIVDHNQAQQSNLLERVLDYRPLAEKLRAFHWYVEEIDGHDMPAILRTFDRVRGVSGQPQAIVAHTVKGKGVSFVENDWSYHGRAVSKDDLPKALAELAD